MNQEKTTGVRQRSLSSPKQLSSKNNDLEENVEISNDEDESDEGVNEPISSNSSIENSDILDSCQSQNTSRSSPLIAESKRKNKLSNAKSLKNNVSKEKGQKKPSYWNIKTFAIGFFIIMSFYLCKTLIIDDLFTNSQNVSSSPELSLDERRFQIFLGDLRAIQNKFPQQNRNTWSNIEAGIYQVLNFGVQPWTFLLFSNETATISCLAELLGSTISKALNTTKSLVLSPRDMGNEYGNTIDHLRPLISKEKAVVVHDLLNINPGAIQAFHTMCDRYNPLVEGAVYILTIITTEARTIKSPEVFIEDVLTRKFINRVHEDKLQPLITRLMDATIISVEPENTLPVCSL